MKIVIIDDEPIICDGLDHIISARGDAGLEVTGTFTDSELALETCNWNDVDLLIIDINMPGISGFDLIAAVRDRGYDFLVLIVSSHADFDFARQALQSSAVDFIVKPVVPAKLFAALDKAQALVLKQRAIKSSQLFLRQNIRLISSAFFEDFIFEAREIPKQDMDRMASILELETKTLSVLEFIAEGRESALKERLEEIAEADGQTIYCFTSGSGLHTLLAVCPAGHPFIAKEFSTRLREGWPQSVFSESLTTTRLDELPSLHETLMGKFSCLDATFEHTLTRRLHDSVAQVRTSPSDLSGYSLPVQQAIKLIGECYTTPLSLTILSERLNIHPTYLSNLFSRQMGMTLIDYLNRYRVMEAQIILQDPLSKVRWVAERVGFADQKYFCQVFKKITGLTPVQYKNNFFLLSRERGGLGGSLKSPD